MKNSVCQTNGALMHCLSLSVFVVDNSKDGLKILVLTMLYT